MQYQREREAQSRTWEKTQDHIPFLPPLADRTLHLCRAANSFVLINTFPSLKPEKLILVKHFFFDHLFIATGKIYPQSLSVKVLFHWAVSFLMLSWVQDCLSNSLLVSVDLPGTFKYQLPTVLCYKCRARMSSHQHSDSCTQPKFKSMVF